MAALARAWAGLTATSLWPLTDDIIVEELRVRRRVQRQVDGRIARVTSALAWRRAA